MCQLRVKTSHKEHFTSSYCDKNSLLFLLSFPLFFFNFRDDDKECPAMLYSLTKHGFQQWERVCVMFKYVL